MGSLNYYLRWHPKAEKKIVAAEELTLRPCSYVRGLNHRWGVRIEGDDKLITIIEIRRSVANLNSFLESEAADLEALYKKPVYWTANYHLIEEAILKNLLPYLKRAKRSPIMGERLTLPEFSLDDLVGKTKIATMRIKNPLPYDPEVASPNPKKFKVMLYSDGGYLLHMDIGWQDGSTLHSFLVDQGKTRYSNKLYEDF
jgi:hypothetical protein